MNLDHFVIGIDSLDAGYRWATETLAIGLQAGGSHSGRGTRNALAGLGSSSYLEVLARDPAQCPTPTLNLPADEPKLLHWCIRSSELEKIEERATALGLGSLGISDWTRQTPAGDTLRWKLLFLGGVSDAAALPFFIN